MLLPPIEQMQEAAVSIALAVGKRAMEDGVAAEISADALERCIRRRLWRPGYPDLIAEEAGCP